MTLYLGAWIMLMLFPLITLQDLCHEIGSIYVCNSCWWALVGRVMNEHLLISVVWGDERLLFPWTGRRTQERWCQNNPLLSFHLFSFSSSWICPWSKISLLQKLRAKLFCAAYLNRLLCFWLWLSPSSETSRGTKLEFTFLSEGTAHWLCSVCRWPFMPWLKVCVTFFLKL